jgi:mitochondrial enoyl-[acyl-carrier protein] reductase / trans-2-enoyl-CoA reductase
MHAACRLFAFGEKPPALRVEEIPGSVPASGEVVVRMLAAPINPADLNVIEGTYGELPDLPATIGNEGCGEIAALGEGVEGLRVGQKVLPLAFGTWSRELVVAADQVIPLPDTIDVEQAAMLAVNPATAWRMLRDFARLEPGDWIVQNAANSGVGRAVIQLARHLGYRTLNVVRREEVCEELRAAGGDVVVTEDVDLRREARGHCGGALPRLALNAVGGASALNLANALAGGSPVVTYGAMGRQPLKIPNGLLIFRNLSFVGFWLRRWKEAATRAEVLETYRMLADLVDRGVLHTPVHRVFALEEIGEAVVEAGRERRGGKVLVGLGGLSFKG